MLEVEKQTQKVKMCIKFRKFAIFTTFESIFFDCWLEKNKMGKNICQIKDYAPIDVPFCIESSEDKRQIKYYHSKWCLDDKMLYTESFGDLNKIFARSC